MKTLGKLKINSEKMLRNEELVNLKGGYDDFYKCCWQGTANCSSCEWSYPGAPCQSGAWLVKC